jgi:hypothetical protein
VEDQDQMDQSARGYLRRAWKQDNIPVVIRKGKGHMTAEADRRRRGA